MDERIKGFLEDNLAGEAREVIDFLEEFSFNGQIALASVFVFAKDNGKSVAEVRVLIEGDTKPRNQSVTVILSVRKSLSMYGGFLFI